MQKSSGFFIDKEGYMQEYDQKATVAYCGTQGSFSEIAANKLFPKGKMIPCTSFREAYDKVSLGEAEDRKSVV